MKKKEMIDTANKPEHLFFLQFTLGSGEYCQHREVNPLLVVRPYALSNTPEMKFKLRLLTITKDVKKVHEFFKCYSN